MRSLRSLLLRNSRYASAVVAKPLGTLTSAACKVAYHFAERGIFATDSIDIVHSQRGKPQCIVHFPPYKKLNNGESAAPLVSPVCAHGVVDVTLPAMILLTERAQAQQSAPHPGTFAGLMELYENNYIRLRRVIPTLPEEECTKISQVAGSMDLHLTVIERFAYTSELLLTYYFERDGILIPEPELRLRIYHDAQLAEVMSAQLRHWPAFDYDTNTHLRSRWHVNRFLFKWLNYCLYQGHRFE